MILTTSNDTVDIYNDTIISMDTDVDLFTRTVYTDKETFTKANTDAPIGDWIGTQVDGSGKIGKSFVGDGTSYIDIISKQPTYNELTGFLGLSFLFKTTSSTTDSLFGIRCKDIPTRSHYAFIHTDGKLYMAFQGYPHGASLGINAQYGYIDKVVNDGEWHHAFVYLDNGDGVTSEFGFYLDGSNTGYVSINNDHMTLSEGDTFDIGCHTNSLNVKSNIMDAEICDFYWSTDPLFKNELANYSFLPEVQFDNHVVDSIFPTYTSIESTIPTTEIGVGDYDATINNLVTNALPIHITPYNEAPSLVVLDTDSFELNALPTNTNVTVKNLFERPYWTGRELFTQSGTDVLVGDWQGAANQDQGLIGKSFSGSGVTTNAYVDISTKTPTLSTSDYFGMSLFMKLNSVAPGPSNWLISIGTTALGNPISNTNIQLHLSPNDGGAFILNVQDDTSLNPPNNKLAVEPMTALVVDKWYHVFCSIDLSAGGTIAPEIWVDGINTVLPTGSLSNDTFPNGFVNSTDMFYVGGANPSSGGTPNTFSDADICNLYWSNNPKFKNELSKYSNLPQINII